LKFTFKAITWSVVHKMWHRLIILVVRLSVMWKVKDVPENHVVIS